jgi:hypothetical protein
MFRILCDPSSESTELCLTEITRGDSQIFCRVLGRCVCTVRQDGQPAVPHTRTHTHTQTGSKLRCQKPTKHTTKYL